MASFTPEQKAFIKDVVNEAMPTIIKRHVDSCPWGKQMSKFIWIGIGMGITMSIMGIATIPQFIQWIGK